MFSIPVYPDLFGCTQDLLHHCALQNIAVKTVSKVGFYLMAIVLFYPKFLHDKVLYFMTKLKI